MSVLYETNENQAVGQIFEQKKKRQPKKKQPNPKQEERHFTNKTNQKYFRIFFLVGSVFIKK